jgi:hypothetical protein
LRRLAFRWHTRSAIPGGVQAANMHVEAREEVKFIPGTPLWSSYFLGTGKSFLLSLSGSNGPDRRLLGPGYLLIRSCFAPYLTISFQLLSSQSVI